MTDSSAKTYDFVIVGGGSAGIATAASILKRNRDVSVAIIEPSEVHYYQPGWTMVGAGVFDPEFTRRQEAKLIPAGVEWIKASASGFAPHENKVLLCDGTSVSYRVLIACPGIKLDWEAIPGLPETLGKNGVTSNYGYDLASYTYRLVKDFKGGRALFTQPVMPIKCAGAPQKAMYLSCYRWEKAGVLKDVDVQFHTAGAVLFGVAAYVPALMDYIERYGAHLNFESKLVAIDGAAKVATFEQKRGDEVKRVEERFDMIHVVPPQVAPDFVRSSPLAAASGFIEVSEATLQHPRFPNVFALGDACSASNAKTTAAVRKQAPVVAVNALAALDGKAPVADYDGYALEIPKASSLIPKHDPDAPMKGLDTVPDADEPPVGIVFWSFRIMVGLGFAMMGIGLWSLIARTCKGLYEWSWLHRTVLAMGPSGFIAVLAGWVTTEVGRQPFTIYGLLRTAESASPLDAPVVAASLLAFVLVYFTVFGAGIWYLLKLRLWTHWESPT